MAAKEFKCTVCGYVHKGDKAPDVCPLCQAPASKFEPVKKELNTNASLFSNGESQKRRVCKVATMQDFIGAVCTNTLTAFRVKTARIKTLKN